MVSTDRKSIIKTCRVMHNFMNYFRFNRLIHIIKIFLLVLLHQIFFKLDQCFNVSCRNQNNQKQQYKLVYYIFLFFYLKIKKRRVLILRFLIHDHIYPIRRFKPVACKIRVEISSIDISVTFKYLIPSEM